MSDRGKPRATTNLGYRVKMIRLVQFLKLVILKDLPMHKIKRKEILHTSPGAIILYVRRSTPNTFCPTLILTNVYVSGDLFPKLFVCLLMVLCIERYPFSSSE
uniref:Uncharacterized protein n=1 Tax=Cucumis melo TaxID=3656 RepID=A0A9I9EAE6_CUCME